MNREQRRAARRAGIVHIWDADGVLEICLNGCCADFTDSGDIA